MRTFKTEKYIFILKIENIKQITGDEVVWSRGGGEEYSGRFIISISSSRLLCFIILVKIAKSEGHVQSVPSQAGVRLSWSDYLICSIKMRMKDGDK